MKINERETLLELNNYLRGINEGEQRQRRGVEEKPNIQTDRVEISQKSREIQKVRNMVENAPDVREAKVKELKNSIESGTYSVRGEKIAGEMIKKSLIDKFL